MNPVIVVHGGAAAYLLVDEDKIEQWEVEEGVISAAMTGYRILTLEGSAVDAVQAAVRTMEDNPIFNCGYGSFLTSEHTIEMDASIMDGATMKTGAVACISNVRNPIAVARAVMDKTPHAMICDRAALNLAKSFGFVEVTTEDLKTTKAINRMKSRRAALQRHPEEHDTVGAVAVDRHGNVAYATSTGGITGKARGRVGDSPVVGAGGYADNRSGAVSTTGDGEAIFKLCLAKQVAMLMEEGQSPQRAVEQAIGCLEERLNAEGGCIAVSSTGQVGIHFNSNGMAWATVKDDQIRYGLYRNENKTDHRPVSTW